MVAKHTVNVMEEKSLTSRGTERELHKHKTEMNEFKAIKRAREITKNAAENALEKLAMIKRVTESEGSPFAVAEQWRKNWEAERRRLLRRDPNVEKEIKKARKEFEQTQKRLISEETLRNLQWSNGSKQDRSKSDQNNGKE